MSAPADAPRDLGGMHPLHVAAWVAFIGTNAFAHAGEAHVPTEVQIWDGLTALALGVVAILFIRGAVRLGRALPRWRMLAFALGWGSVAGALLSPLATWSDRYFSVHMAQHEILMLVSAPLLVAAMPLQVMMFAFGGLRRRAIGAQLRRPQVVAAWNAVTGPLAVLLLHALVLWVWHIPVMFEAALRSETVHVLQHLGFFVTAALFWWALVHGRYGRAGYGIGVLYVFATAMHTQMLGALLTFTGQIWYPTHAARTGANALEDQQFAGIVMWIPFGVVFVIIALALFAAWLGEAERRVRFTSADRLRRGEAPNA